MQSPWLKSLSSRVLGRPIGNDALSATVLESRKAVVAGGPVEDLGERNWKANPGTAGPAGFLWTEDH